jgi:hypothetical protein
VTPCAEEVLAAVVPGRVVRLSLNREQKRALRDRDGQIGLTIVRHAYMARAMLGAPSDSPLQPPFMQGVARKLGHHVGIKRCYAIRRRLIETLVLDPHGSYRQHYRNSAGAGSYRVSLYRLAVRITGRVRRHMSGTPCPIASCRQRRPVKRRRRAVRWWQTVFAGPDRAPPPGISKRRARGMRSLDERESMWL